MSGKTTIYSVMGIRSRLRSIATRLEESAARLDKVDVDGWDTEHKAVADRVLGMLNTTAGIECLIDGIEQKDGPRVDFTRLCDVIMAEAMFATWLGKQEYHDLDNYRPVYRQSAREAFKIHAKRILN